MKEADFVGASSDSVETAQTCKGPTLIGVQEAKGAGGGGKTKRCKSFEDLGVLSLYFSFFFFFSIILVLFKVQTPVCRSP